jgi:hypothetical protein
MDLVRLCSLSSPFALVLSPPSVVLSGLSDLIADLFVPCDRVSGSSAFSVHNPFPSAVGQVGTPNMRYFSLVLALHPL